MAGAKPSSGAMNPVSWSRTMYFAPDMGLVKLTFRHKDGSVSTVERVR